MKLVFTFCQTKQVEDNASTSHTSGSTPPNSTNNSSMLGISAANLNFVGNMMNAINPPSSHGGELSYGQQFLHAFQMFLMSPDARSNAGSVMQVVKKMVLFGTILFRFNFQLFWFLFK